MSRRSFTASRVAVALLVALVASVGCGTQRSLNVPATAASDADRYEFDSLRADPASDSLFLCLALSGDGVGAAALAYGVLHRLRSELVHVNGRLVTLLDEVDCISAVSGGALAAAYYGLFGDRFFDRFNSNILARDFQSALLRRALSPWNVLTRSRAEIFAEMLREDVFGHHTFGDLARAKRRPFVVLNATNVVNSERFEFTSAQFDAIGGDLAKYPIAHAVAASMLFPLGMEPIVLKNLRPGSRSIGSLALNVERPASPPVPSVERWLRQLRDYASDTRFRYVHLVNGALADSTALGAIIAAADLPSGFIRRRLQNCAIRHLGIVMVRWSATEDAVLGATPDGPSLIHMLYSSAAVGHANYGLELIEYLNEVLRRRGDEVSCNPQRYIVEVDTDLLRDTTRRELFGRQPRGFNLPQVDVGRFIAIAEELLRDSSDFQRLLRNVRLQGRTGK